jgi:glycosyltransferase involved in cell wall biosynthesis
MTLRVPAELISIILPTFNRRALLQEAIASIQAQTWPNWELIVLDDGSTDGTPEMVPRDSRMSVVALPHSGNLAALHNIGVARSRGSLIAFQDSDDRWLPDKLAVQAGRLALRRDCGWCYGAFRMIDANGRELPRRSGFEWQPREGRFLREVITTEAGIALQTVLVRREVALAVRFSETIPWGDDYDFVLRLALASPACVVNQIVAEVREHPDRGTHRRYDHMLNFAAAYYHAARLIDERGLRRLCRQRAVTLLREYLANARAAGALGDGLKNAAAAWWRG